ncbi:MAG TPA: thioredoxin domain-containing protein [Pyrinomonadaceae bacterium]|nr:thioredoxin domain-containing protein [Pyrinomonadaceae bacterium]
MKRALPFVIIVLVLVVAVGVAWYLKQASVTPPPPPSPSPSASSTQTPPQVAEPGAQPPHARGDATAPVTIEEFGDFQCPPCGALHPILKSLEKEFGPARLRVIFRQNPLVPAHAHALSAARASEAAGLQGKFWEMHDMIFENQNAWKDAFDSKSIFEGYATKLGLNIEMYRRDIGSEVVERRIFLDGKRGHALGVQGTPTAILNGREVPFEALMQVDRLRFLINAELAAAGK